MRVLFLFLISLFLFACSPIEKDSVEGHWMISNDEDVISGHIEFINGNALLFADDERIIIDYETIDEKRYKLGTIEDFEGGLLTLDHQSDSCILEVFGSSKPLKLIRSPNISNADLLGVWKDEYLDSDGRVEELYVTEIKDEYHILHTLKINHDNRIFYRTIEEDKYSLRNGFIYVTAPETSDAHITYIVSFGADSITYCYPADEVGWTDTRIEEFTQFSIPEGYKRVSDEDEYWDLIEEARLAE